MRTIVCLLVVGAFVFTGDYVHAQKKKPDKPATIDLKGNSLKQVFEELLPGMGAADLAARNGPQQAWQKICIEASAPGKDSMRAEVCQLMIGKLGAEVPNPARIWLLQQLQRIGGEESLDKVALAAQDKDAQVRDEAVRCLASNPSPKATGQLVSLLPGASASAKVGILNALGHRKDRVALPAVAKELEATNKSNVQAAAARALGRMPSQETAKALAAARVSVPKDALVAVNDAYLLCADQLFKDGKHKESLAIYQELNKPAESRGIRLAALQGVLKTSGDDAGTLILDILRGEDVSARQVAIAHIDILSAGALKPLGQQLDKLPIPSQVMVLTAIAARGDKSMVQIAVKASASENDAVSRAGIQSLGRLGDASVVPLLLGKLAAKSAQSAIAGDSLAQIPGEDVTQRLIAALETEKTPAKAVQVIALLGRRKAVSAVPTLLKSAEHPDAAVRNSAFAGLALVAEPKDAGKMIAAYLKLDKKGREQAAPAIVIVCAREADPEKRADPVLEFSSIEKLTLKTEDNAALIRLMGYLGGKNALKKVTDDLNAKEITLNAAAHEAFYSWPDDAAAEQLLRIVENAKTVPQGQAAIRALARVCAIPGGSVPVEKKLDMLKKAMTLAERDDERRAILDNIGFVRHIDTLRYVVPYLDTKALSQSACRAVVELAHSKMLREPNRAEFHKALDRVVAMSKDKQLVERAKDYKQQP